MTTALVEAIEEDQTESRSQASSPGSQPIAPNTEGARPVLRALFKYANRFLMVPIFRLGLGRTLGSPTGGYVMVLKTTGKKSGNIRYAPLNYAILDGNVYCIAGWGRASHWFANLKANPHVELHMPGGSLAGVAEEVTDLQEARQAVLRVLKNAGFATLFEGINPLTATDAQLLERVGQVPVVRIKPTGLANGPYDPGGWGWVWPLLGQAIGLLWLFNRLRQKRRHNRLTEARDRASTG